MNAVLLDSDIVIEILRDRDPAIQSRWAETTGSDNLVLYSPVTAAEIWQGVRENEREAVRVWFTALTCVPIDATIGIRAGEYLQRFRRSHGVEMSDALIAATASVHGLPLWTRNKKHYPMRDIDLY